MLNQASERNRFLVIDYREKSYRQLQQIMTNEHLLDDGTFTLDLAHDVDDALDRLYCMDYKACFLDEEVVEQSRQREGAHVLEAFKRHGTQTATVLLVESSEFVLEPEIVNWLESGLIRVLPSRTLCWTDIYHSIVDLLHRHASVLIVNRHQDQYFFMADTLVRYPEIRYAPSWAENAGDARQQLLNQRFDLLVMDQELPGGSGTELVAELDRMGFAIPAILCTGRERIALDEQALRLLGRRRIQFISRARVTQEPSALPLLCARQLRLQ